MAGINKVILVGNLGKDPEMRYTQSGVPVCSFPMATSETYRDRNTNEKITQTEWHNIVIWRKMAETAEKYLQKGSQVYIEGKLKTRSWDDQQGQKRYTTEIVADVMQLLDRPSGGQRPSEAPHPAATAAGIPSAQPAATAQPSSLTTPKPDPAGDSGNNTFGDPNAVDDLPF
ncbi:MAG: single-stranded DNA-binding protein [Flavobacteriales bacterium]